MIGQRLAAPDAAAGDRQPALADPRNVALKVLKRERQLVRIEPLRPATELRPLELSDNLPQAVDLAVAMSRTSWCNKAGSDGKSSRSSRMSVCTCRPSKIQTESIRFPASTALFSPPPQGGQRRALASQCLRSTATAALRSG